MLAMNAESSRENQGRWTEKDALQFLFFEMGKDGKQAGVSKTKTMDPFSRLLSGGDPAETQRDSAAILQPSSLASEIPSRRQRKGCKPSRLPPPSETTSPMLESSACLDEKKLHSREPCTPRSPPVCPNPACRAQLPSADSFCERCSCCICKQFDVDKDPSLWISCSSDSLDGNDGCGLCCHLECALKEQVDGVLRNGSSVMHDGSYRCPSCGRFSPLISGSCLKKQLGIAKAACSVDTLCHRLYLSRRLFNGTALYKDVQAFVAEATKRLEEEVGPMVEGSAKLVCSVVTGLSCSADVQKLIGLALEKLEAPSIDARTIIENSKLSDQQVKASCAMHFEDVSTSSIVVHVDDDATTEPTGYKLWHRKTSEASYANTPTCVISGASKKALVSNLQAQTKYSFKIVPLSEKGDEIHCEAECCTKADESIHRLKELPFPVGLINTDLKKRNNVNPICLDNGLEMKHTPKELNARSKAHGDREVLVWQQDRAHYANEDLPLSKVCPSILRENKLVKGNDHFSPLSNGKLNTRTDAANVHWGGMDVMQVTSSSTSDGCVNGNHHSKEVPSIVQVGHVDPKPGKTRARKVSCTCLDRPMQEPLGQSHQRISNSEEEKERVIIFDALQCLYNSALCEHCPAARKSLATNGLESDHPHQSWAVQVCSQERGFGMKAETLMATTQAVPSLENVHPHVNGTLSTTCRADCGANSFEFSVKVIRWLECEGHLKEEFRMKFLTWYSLRATDHEKRVVSVFIDTLQDDPESLAGQLMDTFEELVATKRQHLTADGYCGRPWQ